MGTKPEDDGWGEIFNPKWTNPRAQRAKYHEDLGRAMDSKNVNNHVTRVEISERTLSIIAFTVAMASIIFSTFLFAEWKIAEREDRLWQYYTLELDAKLIAAGIKKPEESLAKKFEEK